MAKKKLPFQAFEKCRIKTKKRQQLKGGYRYVPQGVQGSNFIINLADIRNENLSQPLGNEVEAAPGVASLNHYPRK